MTTTVKVSAHCSDDKEVQVSIADSVSGNVRENFVLQNGETADRVVYDDLVISVLERKKA
jgi:O-glycosyl hydrolase